MKNKYIIALFLLGVVVTTIGAFFKITHLEIGPFTGSLTITLGLFIKVVAAIVFITKLLSNKNNDFLNK
jgi:hypothetical protein